MKPIPISSLRLDGGTQQREHLDEQTIQDYADAMLSGATFPPIVAYSDGVDTWLADGFHRVYAAQRAKLKDILADVRRGGQREARWASFAANSTHGLPRTRDDVALILRNIFTDEQWATKPDSEVAKHTGIARTTVRDHRHKYLGETAKIDPGVREVTRNGTTYTQKVSNIGQRQQQAQPDMPDDMDEDQEPESETVVVNKQTGEVMDVDDVEVVKTETTSLKVRGKGVELAHKAIAVLKEIPPSDALRVEGFNIVARWIRDNK